MYISDLQTKSNIYNSHLKSPKEQNHIKDDTCYVKGITKPNLKIKKYQTILFSRRPIHVRLFLFQD